MGILVALLVLSVLIFFHELGHFTAARFFGVQIDVFSIGFGKRLWTKKIGKTEWSISAIPLGGYVRMKGQDDTDPTKVSYDEDSYNTKKPWQRIVILLAGPFANFLMAFLLYLAIAYMGVPKLLPYVDKVTKDSPAYQAGLQKKDKILQINGINIRFWEDIGKQINASQGKLTMIIERDHHLKTLTLKPKVIEDKNVFGEMVKRRIIGITPLPKQTTVIYGFTEGWKYAWDETVKASTLIFKSVQKLITGEVSTDQLGGIITIVDVTAQASHAGILALFFFTALISVNLGVLNLMPIPALDGGHIMFNLYEMLRGKAPSENVMYYMTVTGWVLLAGLMFLGIYNDIHRLMG
ncbi:RIP metalloprotease RseP [Sulfurovum sp. NBC37-1]|uniref:RIP metalloprotease RseP n=1 Tax=Sulfurovum sp. (strain NBC37-1) TaxID=387093 RepID=UPI00015878BB|nr:RIP metalloprotease RseP [Sulfurovum sp. NBC37-1]BAF71714.1 membrane-associated zinc metalloprotease [Sulfurovum sp. NBC37-1]